MARGRMISKSLSTSEKRAALHDEAGKLAEFCQALYPLLVAHADDWGCLQGDVFTVKHLVDPTSPRRLVDFEAALMALHNVGLVRWYEADDVSGTPRWFVYIESFAAHQTLKGHTNDGRRRTFPEPPENVGKFESLAQSRPVSPKRALREEKRTEEKRTEPIRSPENPGTAEDDGQKEEKADVSKFIARFCDLYRQHRHGARYFIVREKHVPLLRALLRTYGLERLEKLALVMLKTDDEWIDATDRGIGILSTKASWLDGRLAEYEAAHGSIQVAS
jgi:hypothetical protein